MTTKEVFQHYENIISAIMDGHGTADTETSYEEGDILAAFLAALDTAEDAGGTCGAELADEISKYNHVQYYMNLMCLRGVYTQQHQIHNPVRNT